MISSAEEFLSLLENEPRDMRRRAVHDSAPLPVWLDVLQRYPEHRAAVGWNKTIPAEIITRLARDEDWRIRCDIASKRATPIPILEELGNDASAPVRGAVARNPATPAEVLERLSADPDSDVRSAAGRRLGRVVDDELPVDVDDPRDEDS